MKVFAFTLLMITSLQSLATTVVTTKITRVLVGEVYGDMVFIGVANKPSIPGGHCQSNPDYNYIFDPTTSMGKVTLSILLAAYAAQKDVYINGYDSCTIYSGVENLRQLELK